MVTENAGMVTYRIPREEMKMGVLFAQLQGGKEALGVEDYSVSQPTLEQVNGGFCSISLLFLLCCCFFSSLLPVSFLFFFAFAGELNVYSFSIFYTSFFLSFPNQVFIRTIHDNPFVQPALTAADKVTGNIALLPVIILLCQN